MMNELQGKVAVVTGAGRGIGFGIASVLCRRGAKVLVADMDEETAKKAAEQLRADGGEADYVVVNVARREDAQKMVDTAVERFGGLHILVNNAGINRDAMLHKMTKSEAKRS